MTIKPSLGMGRAVDEGRLRNRVRQSGDRRYSNEVTGSPSDYAYCRDPRPAELRGAGDMARRWPGPRVRRFVVGVFVIALIATAGARMSIKAGAGIATAQAATPLRKIAEFELPGPPGKRFDYLTIAEEDNYLLSAH